MTTILNALKKKKTPEQIVRVTSIALAENNSASLSKRLNSIKEILYGEENKAPVDAKCSELSAALQASGIMPELIKVMPDLPFETRKDLSMVFSNLMRKNHENFSDYVFANPSMVITLVSVLNVVQALFIMKLCF